MVQKNVSLLSIKSVTYTSIILCITAIISGICFIDVDKWWYELWNGPPHWTERIFERVIRVSKPVISTISDEETMGSIVIRPVYSQHYKWLRGFKLSTGTESTIVEFCDKGYYIVTTLNDKQSRTLGIFSEEEVDEYIENHYFKNLSTSTLVKKLESSGNKEFMSTRIINEQTKLQSRSEARRILAPAQ